MMITQFGVNMLVPIFLCSFAGMYLDRWLNTSFWMVALFLWVRWRDLPMSSALRNGSTKRRHRREGAARRARAKKSMMTVKRMTMKKKIDPTLFELCLGILAYGVIFEIVLLFFSRKPAYSIGLWIGVFLAVAGAFHMWWSLDRGLICRRRKPRRV